MNQIQLYLRNMESLERWCPKCDKQCSLKNLEARVRKCCKFNKLFLEPFGCYHKSKEVSNGGT